MLSWWGWIVVTMVVMLVLSCSDFMTMMLSWGSGSVSDYDNGYNGVIYISDNLMILCWGRHRNDDDGKDAGVMYKWFYDDDDKRRW